MLDCFINTAKNAIPIFVVTVNEYPNWLQSQSHATVAWLKSSGFKNEAGMQRLIPNNHGELARVVVCVDENYRFWGVAGLAMQLPEGNYSYDGDDLENFALAWGLGSYQFTKYKAPLRQAAKLLIATKEMHAVESIIASIFLVRDLINTPTDDMGPSELSQVTQKIAHEFKAQFHEIVGDELLKKNFAAIHTVGRASDDAPRLLDMQWGNPKHPKITLVGKGVCFDSGGLDLKPSSGMLLMKKDMGGAAHVLGLARMIMSAKLPIRLRVLIPAVENVVSGNSYRPGDIIKSRNGLTIEIGNTDAEGRVVLADAITEAVNDQPQLLIDIATLTGAARVALGTDLPAFFCNNDIIAEEVLNAGMMTNDLMWRMPLYAPYRELLNSNIANINNNSSEPFGGAITAAIFLKEFVGENIPWMHFDLYAWNLRARPGRPQGGEAMVLRALFEFIKRKYSA